MNEALNRSNQYLLLNIGRMETANLSLLTNQALLGMMQFTVLKLLVILFLSVHTKYFEF
jgi:hypothetical protein